MKNHLLWWLHHHTLSCLVQMSTVQSSCSEREALLAESEAARQLSAEDQHKLLSVSQERDQLHQMLQLIRQEKQQLTEELDHKVDILLQTLAVYVCFCCEVLCAHCVCVCVCEGEGCE